MGIYEQLQKGRLLSDRGEGKGRFPEKKIAPQSWGFAWGGKVWKNSKLHAGSYKDREEILPKSNKKPSQ